MLNDQDAPSKISKQRLEAMRERLRAGMAEQSARIDRSWQFQIANGMARIPAPLLAAAALLIVGFSAYGGWHAVEHATFSGFTGQVEADALPIRALTPGATERVTADDLCAGRGPSKVSIAPSVRQAVLHDYRLDGLPDEEYELDYLITPELGGSADRRNLWPERYGSRIWNARVKDELEGLLPALVCRGAVDLSTAQQDIAADWVAAYKKYFHTDRPVSAQAQALPIDQGFAGSTFP